MTEANDKGSGRAELRAFVLLHAAALASIEQARTTPHLSLENCLHAIVDSAFSLEAYLNHVGPKLLTFWPSLERLGWRQKLEVAISHLGLTVEFGARPFQSVLLAFKVRDLAAHARTETLTFDQRLPRDAEGMPIRPVSQLEEFCNLRIADQVVTDLARVIELIHEATDYREEALWFSAEVEWTRP